MHSYRSSKQRSALNIKRIQLVWDRERRIWSYVKQLVYEPPVLKGLRIQLQCGAHCIWETHAHVLMLGFF